MIRWISNLPSFRGLINLSIYLINSRALKFFRPESIKFVSIINEIVFLKCDVFVFFLSERKLIFDADFQQKKIHHNLSKCLLWGAFIWNCGRLLSLWMLKNEKMLERPKQINDLLSRHYLMQYIIYTIEIWIFLFRRF